MTNITDITVRTTAAVLISFSALTLLLIVVIAVALFSKAVLVGLIVLLVVDTLNFVTIVIATVVLQVVDDIPEESQNMFFFDAFECSQDAPQSACVNDCAPPKILYILVTDDTFHTDRSWLNDVAPCHTIMLALTHSLTLLVFAHTIMLALDLLLSFLCLLALAMAHSLTMMLVFALSLTHSVCDCTHHDVCLVPSLYHSLAIVLVIALFTLLVLALSHHHVFPRPLAHSLILLHLHSPSWFPSPSHQFTLFVTARMTDLTHSLLCSRLHTL